MGWKNIEDKKRYNKWYRQTHKSQIAEKDRAYRLKNKEKLKQKQKEWIENNRDHVRESGRVRMAKWRKENPQLYKQYTVQSWCKACRG